MQALSRGAAIPMTRFLCPTMMIDNVIKDVTTVNSRVLTSPVGQNVYSVEFAGRTH